MGEEIRGKWMTETVKTKTPDAARSSFIVIKLRIEKNTLIYRNMIFLSILSFYLDASSMMFLSALVFLIEFLTFFFFTLCILSSCSHLYSMVHILSPQ